MAAPQLDDLAAMLACRNHLLTLQFAGTGVTTLQATGNGYTQLAGDFTAQGFVPGMEVVPGGFANVVPDIILKVSPLEILTEKAHPLEASAVGRSLTVGIPPLRVWENTKVKILDERWYIEEDYLPDPASIAGITQDAQFQSEPMYVVRLYGLSGRGSTAIYRVAMGIRDGFTPRLPIAMPNGALPLVVKTSPAPYLGKPVPVGDGRTCIVITIPLWTRINNPS